MKGWLISLATLSFIICLWDIKFRKVPNALCLIVAALCFALLVCYGQWINLIHSGAIILVGIFLSYFRLLGGGDTKLLAAYSLAISPAYLPATLLMVALVGGGVSLLYWLWLKLINSQLFSRKRFNNKLLNNKAVNNKAVNNKAVNNKAVDNNNRGVPYAIAICLGCYLGILASVGTQS
ncbi:MAG: A24 family peptidase [Shewanella sp.]|nr:A24 family peptidase [Shewanella sp.]MCF1430172.1 A24 family peptidase [Shewanella sp.]MCF1456250.1 A24 family peptidase [Shewanella sp.]